MTKPIRAEGVAAAGSQGGRATLPMPFLLLLLIWLGKPALGRCQTTLGAAQPFLSETSARGAFPLLAQGVPAPLFVSPEDEPAVLRAAGDLQADLERVSGQQASLTRSDAVHARFAILAGTLGHSPLIDGLVAAHKLDADAIRDKWESFTIRVVDRPLPGVDQALVIAGSDRRGTIYGLYECSEEAGVSPWYWWADVPVRHHRTLYALPAGLTQGPPVVKYRGIFLNDEDPALSGWSKAKFGGVNSAMYAHVFELLLRLRANYLWPAMWGKAFNEDDPADPRLADLYGIVMGTSHHEPMMRAQAEWTHHHTGYGNGQWNYATNGAGLRQFWTDGVVRNKGYEDIYTIGMRGDGDKAMPDAGGLEASKKLLEQIIADQREILRRNVNPEVSQVPQLWALFTEVQKYYDAGLKVPDDVTLLFTDDNVGNLRRVPTAAERGRAGGSGIYFHMDMNGGPFSYKWLNSNPLPKIWEQMNLAYRYGADRIWISNVGDLKPLEVPIEFFLRMAWDPARFGPDSIAPYLQHWATRDFGPEHAQEIASLVARYAKFNASPKPELVRPTTFSQVNYQEAERVYAEWTGLAAEALRLRQELPADEQDAYYELVLHPVLACGNAVELYIVAGRNHLFALQGRASANTDVKLANELFARDRQLTDYYNHVLADGKWDHMMDQTHLGYVSWQSPKANLEPTVESLTLPAAPAFGVAVEGAERAWPEEPSPVLPVLDSLRTGGSFLTVFQRASSAVPVQVEAGAPWIVLRKAAAFSSSPGDQRYWVSADWSRMPVGESQGTVRVSGGGAVAEIQVRALRATPAQVRDAEGSFAALEGPVALDAIDTSARSEAGGVRWVTLPDYGREDSAVTVLPVTAPAVAPGAPAPTLSYPLFWNRPGPVEIDLVTNPTLDIHPDSRLAVSVSLDGAAPDTEAVFTEATRASETFLGSRFGQNDRANARIMHFHQTVGAAGRHTLGIRMVDPTIVIEKIIVHDQPLPASFFGPPSQKPFHQEIP